MPCPPRSPRRIATPLALVGLLLALGCGGGNDGPASPDASATALPTVESTGVTAPIGAFNLTVTSTGVQLEPVAARGLMAQGDSYDANLTSFLRRSPCADCLRVEAFGLTPDRDVWVDISMKHPFKPSATLRPDLVVYDPRVILIPELDFLATGALPKFQYPDSPDVTDAGAPIGVWDIVRNADGYTNHHDILTDLFTLPGETKFDGNLNPFKWYFNEDDPSADFDGAEIPEHRMRPGDGPDVKRWLIDITDPAQGTLVERKFAVVVEASFGQGTTRADRSDYIERLPEFQVKEAYDIQTDLPQTLFADTPQNTLIGFSVMVRDWQRDTIAGTGINQVNCPSDVVAVSVDLPGEPGLVGFERIFPYAETNTPSTGTGVAGDPYVFSFALPTQGAPDLTPLIRNDPYLALIRVEDEYNLDVDRTLLCHAGAPDADGRVRSNFPKDRANNQELIVPIDDPGDDDPLIQDTISDFVAYRIVPVFIRPSGPPTVTLNPPITDNNKGLVTLSGTILGLDQSIQSLPGSARRTVTTITQVGPGGAPMNTPWVLPLQPDQYGRFQITMPLLPGGNNSFTVDANNQYAGVVPGATASAGYPLIPWNPIPAAVPGFRVSMAWEPNPYQPSDSSDLDLHLWEPDPAPGVFQHLYYCNASGPNQPGTLAKPCSTSDSINQARVILRDDNGYGPEVIDGLPNAALLPSRQFPIGVNYFTNRRNALTFTMQITIRIATYSSAGVGTDLQILTNNVKDRENFNNPLEFYGGNDPSMTMEYLKSWYRPADIQTDATLNASIGPPLIADGSLLK